MSFVAATARRNGGIAAMAAAFIASGGVYLANEMSPRFRGALGISGKMALIVTPTAGAFFLRSHQTVHEARADPDEFVAGRPAPKAPECASRLTQPTLAVDCAHPVGWLLPSCLLAAHFICIRSRLAFLRNLRAGHSISLRRGRLRRISST